MHNIDLFRPLCAAQPTDTRLGCLDLFADWSCNGTGNPPPRKINVRSGKWHYGTEASSLRVQNHSLPLPFVSYRSPSSIRQVLHWFGIAPVHAVHVWHSAWMECVVYSQDANDRLTMSKLPLCHRIDMVLLQVGDLLEA
jgi:hypothetical protein